MVLASLAIVLALVVAYARQAAVDSDQFANRATAALRDDSVRSLIAEKLTDEVVLKNQADLIAARPLIESVASEVVGGRAFTSLFRKAVRDVHRALFKRDQEHRHAHRGRCGHRARGRARAGAPGPRPGAQVDRAGRARRAEHRQPQRDARRHRRAGSAAGAAAPGALLRPRGRRALSRARQAPDGRRARRGSRGGRRPARGGVLRRLARSPWNTWRARRRRPRPARCGMRSSATFAPRRGSWPAAAWWSRRPPPR